MIWSKRRVRNGVGSWPAFGRRFDEKVQSAGNVEFFFRRGGSGAPVLLLHGHTQTSDMWGGLAEALVDERRTVIAPDMHGLGRTSIPKGGYDKKTMARDLRALISEQGFEQAPLTVIGHDLGVFAAYAYAAQFAETVDRLIIMEATVPGVGAWPELLQQPQTWHFGFYGPHAEKLVLGRERVYLDRFWDEFAANPNAITERMRKTYTAYYERPNGLYGAFSHFAAFGQDASDNVDFASTKLPMPVHSIAGDSGLGVFMEPHVAEIAETRSSTIIENAGHWLLEEQPELTINSIRKFLF